MALRTPSYTYGDAFSSIQRQYPRVIEDSNAALIANMATDMIWHRYDWKQSIKTLPPFYLVPNEQDHYYPAAVVPSDFYGLRKANLCRTQSEPPAHYPLSIIRDLELTHQRALPSSICFDRAQSAFRVFPRVPNNIGAPDYVIEGEYKCFAPKVSAAGLMATIIPFDDTYIRVMLESLKWAALNLAGDPRAGEVGYEMGSTKFTGQMGKMMAAIDDMAGKEGLELGDQVIRPAEPLIGASSYTLFYGQRW
jgi:hypothetical protein